MTRKTGWKNEPARHSLAARGVKTGNQRKKEAKARSIGHYDEDGEGPYTEEIGEHSYYEKSDWTCSMRGKKVHLGLMTEILDAEEYGIRHPKGYPVRMISSVMVAPKSTSPDYIEENLENSMAFDDVFHPIDSYLYSGGVPVNMDAIRSDSKSNVQSTMWQGDRWFRDESDARQYFEDVHSKNLDTVFSAMLGAVLDKRMNRLGDTGWDKIRLQAFNSDRTRFRGKK